MPVLTGAGVSHKMTDPLLNDLVKRMANWKPYEIFMSFCIHGPSEPKTPGLSLIDGTARVPAGEKEPPSLSRDSG